MLSFATPAQASHSWNGYQWARTVNPFGLVLGDNVDHSKRWGTYLSTASSDWTKLTIIGTAVAAGSTTPRTCRPSTGSVEVCSASYGRTGWLGLASISITGGTHITQGTVKQNDTYFDTATYNNPNEKLHVMCHGGRSHLRP